jgi:hypothetical protein
MALFEVAPCPKCGANRWRLIGLVRRGADRVAELVCVHCATSIYVGEKA